MTKLDAFTYGEHRIAVVQTDRCVRLLWSGRATMRDPRAALLPYFTDVFAAAKADGLGVEFHLVELQACNSATIASIIDATRLAREAEVPMEVVYDGAVRWQRTSFEALRMFATRQAFAVRAA